MATAFPVRQGLVEDHRPTVPTSFIGGQIDSEAGNARVANHQVPVVLPAVVPELDHQLPLAGPREKADRQVLHTSTAVEVVVRRIRGEGTCASGQFTGEQGEITKIPAWVQHPRNIADLRIETDVLHRCPFLADAFRRAVSDPSRNAPRCQRRAPAADGCRRIGGPNRLEHTALPARHCGRRSRSARHCTPRQHTGKRQSRAGLIEVHRLARTRSGNPTAGVGTGHDLAHRREVQPWPCHRLRTLGTRPRTKPLVRREMSDREPAHPGPHLAARPTTRREGTGRPERFQWRLRPSVVYAYFTGIDRSSATRLDEIQVAAFRQAERTLGTRMRDTQREPLISEIAGRRLTYGELLSRAEREVLRGL